MGRGWAGGGRTYSCLGLVGARGREPEFAQRGFGLGGEGVEAGFGRLWRGQEGYCAGLEGREEYHVGWLWDVRRKVCFTAWLEGLCCCRGGATVEDLKIS